MDLSKIITMSVLSILVLVVALNIIPATDELNSYETNILLKTGKNYLTFNQSVYAKEIIILNPEIESVSYFDEFLNRSVGYVNAFGGVGSNFLINSKQGYEINVRKDINLRLLN